MKGLVALFSGLLIAVPAVAQSGPTAGANFDHGASNIPSDTRHTGDTNERGERLICRTVSGSSTSRMASRRVCHTEAEWREIARENDD